MFRDGLGREWWGLVWSRPDSAIDLAHQLVDSGLATAAQLEEISTAWREWAAAPDGWLAIPHGETLPGITRHTREARGWLPTTGRTWPGEIKYRAAEGIHASPGRIAPALR